MQKPCESLPLNFHAGSVGQLITAGPPTSETPVVYLMRGLTTGQPIAAGQQTTDAFSQDDYSLRGSSFMACLFLAPLFHVKHFSPRNDILARQSYRILNEKSEILLG